MNELNQILSDYLLGLPIITIPLSLFAIIIRFNSSDNKRKTATCNK